ncbi:EAL domain-containing protein [Rheinheimera baltica]|uniref:EAL domain-containing protein n=1 Tax=Rheinheimera baltica TaxID=67576 RepID=UPI00273DB8B3|nr:EAL domain-containing protein [Rheinheimera baltica]MDP5142079.1 EAL domain-containing protein [Rheinheimera baltica]MDP5150548.1 EAL domain-containing protein [Rheinheimera baltica]
MRTAVHGILLLLWLFSAGVHAFHAETNTLQRQLNGRQTLPLVYYQISPQQITLDDLLSDPVYHHSFSLLPSTKRLIFNESEAVWLFARLRNSNTRTLQAILEYDFPLADKIEIYQVDRHNQDITLLSRTGNDYPFSERALPYRSFAVNINLAPAEETDIFIKIQDAAVIPSELLIWDVESFTATKQQQAMLDGLLQGFLLLLALYNLILLQQSKAKYYLYYAGFFVSFALVIAILNGMAFKLLWPGYPEINQAILYIAAGFNLLCLNMFVRYAVRTISGFWWHLCHYISTAIALALLFSPLFTSGQSRLFLLLFAASWVLSNNLLLAIRLSLRGQEKAKSFIWACVFTFISALLITLNQAGYLHANFDWSFILFSLVLLCLALTSFNLHKFQIQTVLPESDNTELAHYRDIFNNAVEGMFTTTLDGALLNANQALLDILGYNSLPELKQAIAGTGMSRFYADPSERQHMLKQLELGSKKNFEIQGLRGDNSAFWALMSVRLSASNAQKTAFVHGSVIDITEQKLAYEQLAYLANHDTLTSLYNRYYFEQQLQSLCDQSGSDKGCVMYIDVDQFKLINNSCSHCAGDTLLKQLSDVLKRTVHHNGPLARLDSDEFGVLLAGKNANEAFSLAYRMLDAIREMRFIWQDSVYTISICIGIAEIQQDDSIADSVLKKADAACDIAKQKGHNRIQLFDANDLDTQHHQAEVQWVKQLSRAVQEDRFVLFQQAIKALGPQDNGLHYELLLRLRAEDDSLVTPGSFLNSAERYGLMPQIDRWVIKHYFRWLQQQPKHLSQLYLCNINLSGSSLLDPTFKQDTQLLFEQYQIPFDRICFEITESVAIINLQSTLAFIEHFRAKGCRFALDDFGSGFSSYSYLKQFPADFVKIDGHFVRDLLDDHYDKAIVKSIHEVARAMGMQTVAEFVETDEILSMLQMMGIDYVQGYCIARPKPLSALLNE